jgi:hypothetical protein
MAEQQTAAVDPSGDGGCYVVMLGLVRRPGADCSAIVVRLPA